MSGVGFRRVVRFLVGRSGVTAGWLLAVAVSAFVVTFVFHTPSDVFGPYVPVGLLLWPLVLVAVLLSAVGTSRNGGLLVGWALAAGPGFGFFVPLTAFDLGAPSEPLAWGLGAGAAFAVVFGSLGFVLGVGTRRAVSAAVSRAFPTK